MGSTGLTLTGPWDRATKITQTMQQRFVAAYKKAILQEAHFLRGKLVKNLTSGGAEAGAPFKPHSPFSYVIRKFVGARGGTKPLMTTIGIGAIIVQKQGGGIFVGARGSAQFWRDPVTHEYGLTRQTTERQQRFLAAALRSAGLPGGKVLVLRIPARPFIGPVFAKFASGSQVQQRVTERIQTMMGGDLGRA